ncbi:MAG: TonB-dependent receptor [Halieaceae bacterium]|jgi:iron complex outermembrane receptor protein|nr:TonB-dependent receptor [Halieaceae bacterium]
MSKYKNTPNAMRPLAIAVALAGGALLSAPTLAQEPQRRGGSAALLEEVVVTARKREEGAQEVPLSVTAFNSDQINALKVRDLNDLTVGMPNVTLEDVGTARGTANFSIRGLGVNSSIPSIDPTVGVFVNGVYLGTNSGVIFDTFDLESIEVLRGPQGTLFGRNVTGGAVLLNTKKPGDEFEANFRTAVETGDIGGVNTYVMGGIGGPVTDTLGARLVLYYNDDDGQLENNFTGDDVLGIEQQMARATVTWSPADRTDFTFTYEYLDTDGDGPAGQSHTNGSGVPGTPINNDRDDFDLSIDEVGFQETETNFFIAQLDQGVDFGDGTITAILGYREYESESNGDIDAQPVWVFHSPAFLDTEQTSFELRYNGLFADKANVTAGIFYFENDMDYHERRNLAGVLTGNTGPAVRQDGGGIHDTEAFTVFAQVDYDLSEQWTLTAGVNYSSEEKDVQIASLALNTSLIPALGGTGITECNIVNGPACAFDFVDDESWDNWAPKLGLTYHIDDRSRLYGHWTVGYRSGGYNLRNTSADPNDTPGPFDEEEVNNFEIGYKSTHDWGRLNAAIFYQEIDDQQREVNLPSETAGLVQLIRNTADTTIAGIEVDSTISLTENLLLLASIGYIDAEYDTVRFDLNGDGVVDGADEDLDIPRAPELTWSLGLTHDLELGSWGYMTSRVTWSYRDDIAYTDNNLGFIDEVDILDAGLDFYSNDGHWVFSLYGKNLLDEVNFGNDTQLPDALLGAIPLGGTFSPVMPGIRYGAEITYNFF